MKKKLIITQLSETEFDIEAPDMHRDAHLRFEDGEWRLDMFDSTLPKDRNDAHLDSASFLPHLSARPNWNDILTFLAGL